MVMYLHLDPVSLSLQPLLVAFPYQQGPDCLTKPRDFSGGAAVLSTRAPALQVWQILDRASSGGPGDQVEMLALCLEMAKDS